MWEKYQWQEKRKLPCLIAKQESDFPFTPIRDHCWRQLVMC
jgi:hypothetical protein